MARKETSGKLDSKVVRLEEEAQRRREEEVRVHLLEFLAANPALTQTAIAKQIGVTAPVVSSFLKRKYKGDNAKVASKIARWLEHREEAEEIQSKLPEEPGWVHTPTGERLLTALNFAQALGDIACIYGSAGLGKTRACEQYAARSPNVWLVTITTPHRSVYGAMRALADAVGLRGMPGSSGRLFDEIVRQLSGTRGLLIVDEAQHLTAEALEAVRAVHDRTGIGIALVGNEIVYGRLTGGSRSVGFAQLFSRIGKRVNVKRPTTEDIEELATAWGITDKSARRKLQEIGECPGALRAVVKTIRLASMIAHGAGSKRVAREHLDAAWRDLGGASWAA